MRSKIIMQSVQPICFFKLVGKNRLLRWSVNDRFAKFKIQFSNAIGFSNSCVIDIMKLLLWFLSLSSTALN